MTRAPTPDPTSTPTGAPAASESPSRVAAAARAEHLRACRASTVEEIRAGSLRLAALAEGPATDEVDQVKIVVLAEAMPGLGKVRARQVLDALAIPHATRWGELGDRRLDLIKALDAAASGTTPPTAGPANIGAVAQGDVTGPVGGGA